MPLHVRKQIKISKKSNKSKSNNKTNINKKTPNHNKTKTTMERNLFASLFLLLHYLFIHPGGNVASPSTQSQYVNWNLTAAKNHVWVHHPATSGVCLDVCGLCHLRRCLEPWEIKLEGHAEPGMSFNGPGETGLASHRYEYSLLFRSIVERWQRDKKKYTMYRWKRKEHQEM